VRVEIKPTQISISDGDENDDDDDATKSMECLRVKVSDNGCGMEDIDACVSAFRSTKNGVDTGDIDGQCSSQQQQSRGKQNKNGKQSKSKSKKKKESSSSANNNHASSSSSSSYTSGRYGVGLTLCLLHAQRLVPNSVTLIVTSTKSSDYWTIRRYRADTDKDEIVCLKEERLPKIDKEECGTIVEVLVPVS
jgi:predicted ATP-dependent serine protease